MSDTILKSKSVITRKDHKCFGCNELLLKGSKVISETWVFDGEIISGHYCDTCHTLLSELDPYEIEFATEGNFKEFERWQEIKLASDTK